MIPVRVFSCQCAMHTEKVFSLSGEDVHFGRRKCSTLPVSVSRKNGIFNPAFSDLSITERNSVQERVLSEIMGRMMEDVVLLETKLANPKKQVFVLQFAIGEFDMVVFDPASSSCEIYEIKHSAEIVSEQTRHLIDEEKCRATEHRFGTIKGKYVIYRGHAKTVGEVQYLNVEEYLCDRGFGGKRE